MLMAFIGDNSQGQSKARVDYYLYGYPHGARPRVFRSPKDFLPRM